MYTYVGIYFYICTAMYLRLFSPDADPATILVVQLPQSVALYSGVLQGARWCSSSSRCGAQPYVCKL